MNLLMVNGEHILLSELVDLERLGTDITGAAQAGGGLVDVSPAHDQTRCVLITPQSTVLLEKVDTESAASEHEDPRQAEVEWSISDESSWSDGDILDLL